MKKVRNLNKYFIAIYTILYSIVYLKLLYTYPYSADDWMWGSSLGLDLLHKGFADYNGRYLGNLLVLVLTRNKFIKSLIMMAVLLIIVYLFSKLIRKTKNKFLFVATSGLLLIFMPNQLLAQGIVWSAGFANYVPPMMFVVGYIAICRKLLKDESPSYGWGSFIGCIILGICASLFMEHVTMYNVVLAITVIVFAGIKFKKAFKANIGYLIGSIIGTITMFSNGSYWLIKSGQDYDRRMGLHIVINHLLGNIYRFVAEYNVVLNLILILLVIAIYAKYIKKVGKRKVIGIFLIIYMIMYWCYSAYVYVFIAVPKHNMLNIPHDPRKLNVVGVILAVTFYVVLLIMFALYVMETRNKILSILLLLSVGTLTVPLFVVDPIGPRCFMPMYILYVGLVGVLIDEIDIPQKIIYVLVVIIAILTIGGMVRQFKIYTPMEKLYQERIVVQNYQVNEGHKTIVLPDTVKGDNENVWAWSPGYNWTNQYRTYFGLPHKDKLKFISTKKWLEKYSFLLENQ